jgi:curved DNA-binding protein CbpA
MDPYRAYRVLGLPPGAPLEDVKIAWRDLAQVWHPDRFPPGSRLRAKAEENIKRINAAWDALREFTPTAPPGALRRLSTSFSAILGLGEVGEPPPDAAAMAGADAEPGSVRILAPTGPVGLRSSLRVLGLEPGASPRRRRQRRRRLALFLLVLLLAAAAGLVLLRW